jgi:hypothetical protein
MTVAHQCGFDGHITPYAIERFQKYGALCVPLSGNVHKHHPGAVPWCVNSTGHIVHNSYAKQLRAASFA